MTEFKGDTGGAIKQFYALLEHINQAIGDILTPYIRWFKWILEATDGSYSSGHGNKGRSAPRRRPSRKAKHTPPCINYGQAWQRCPQRHWQRESRGKWQMERDAS